MDNFDRFISKLTGNFSISFLFPFISLVVEKFIFEDLRNRGDLALAWVYHEYANFQGYTSSASQHEKPSVTPYDECLTGLLTGLLERPDQREG